MKHLAPIQMFGPGKGQSVTREQDRDFRAEVEKVDDDKAEGDTEDQEKEASEDSEGEETPVIPKD